MRARGLTLVELLAVVVILALVAGLGTAGLAATAESAGMRAAATQIQLLDRQARIAARTREGVLVIRVKGEAPGTVTLRRLATGELLSTCALAGVVCAFESNGEALSEIAFDRLGESVDYRCTLRRDAALSAWRICGLTGFMRAEDGR